MAENFRPYGVEGHRHAPEIEQELRRLGAHGTTTFVPHLLPIEQGLLASCYVAPVARCEPRGGQRPLRGALRERAIR